MKIIRITTDVTYEVRDVPAVNLDALYAATGADTVDVFDLPAVGMSVWVDDEGLYAREPNALGMAWLRNYGALRQPLHGDFAVTGLPDAEGNCTGLNDEQIANVARLLDANGGVRVGDKEWSA